MLKTIDLLVKYILSYLLFRVYGPDYSFKKGPFTVRAQLHVSHHRSPLGGPCCGHCAASYTARALHAPPAFLSSAICR